MSDDTKNAKDLSGPQDPQVQRFRPKPEDTPQRRLALVGFLGDSDRPGHRRLYFTARLDYYVEFKIDDALAAVSIPPERAPFPGAEATEVTLREGAVLSYTRTTQARPVDEFDIDLRRLPRRTQRRPHLRAAATDWGTCGEECGSLAGTCPEATCIGATCGVTCDETCGGEATCAVTCGCPPSQQCTGGGPGTCNCNTEAECPTPSLIETACNTCAVVTRCQPFCP
jgi:hypothetical protein